MPEWKGPVRQLDAFRYEIPRSYKPAMRTDGLMFVDEKMLPSVLQDNAPEQVANAATMPGIVGKAMAMPDIHWGYGFPIGGVAAFDMDEGVISPGSIGFDVNCLDKASHVLTEHGYRLPISDFATRWRTTRVASVNPSHRTLSTEIAAFMRFRADMAYRVHTATGVEITATHPETETPIIQTDSAEVSTVVNSTEALVLPLTLARGLRNPMTFSGAFRRVLEGDEGTLSDEQPDCGRVVAQNLMAKREPQSVLPTVWNRVPRNSSVGED